jgi:ribosomal protein S20
MRNKKSKTRRSRRGNKRGNPNQEYKRKIRSLVRRATSGDAVAEKELRAELEKSTTAVWVLKHMIKVESKRLPKFGDASSAIRSKSSIYKGNSFKPYSGGLPSLGKKK